MYKTCFERSNIGCTPILSNKCFSTSTSVVPDGSTTGLLNVRQLSTSRNRSQSLAQRWLLTSRNSRRNMNGSLKLIPSRFRCLSAILTVPSRTSLKNEPTFRPSRRRGLVSRSSARRRSRWISNVNCCTC